jgi:NAD(P)-dependent dehydrogenase (short-subunit alcohol dehydrogenase family)
MDSMRGQVALVTGASRGCGRGSRCAATTPGSLIVNIARVLDRPHSQAFYQVLENGTNRLTEHMADDLRPHGVACVAVSPGTGP